MTALVMILVSLCSFASSPANLNSELPRLISESYAAKENFKDLTNELRTRGIPEAEVLAIETFIKSQGVPLSTELAKEKFTGKTITFGDQRLSWNETLQVKTGAGRLLKLDTKMKADEVFTQTYNALMKKETSAWTLMVPDAHAQSLERARAAASAAGWNVLMWSSQIATTGAAAILEVFGGAALVAERVKTALANTTRGHVKCGAHGEYIVDGSYKYYDRKKEYAELIRIENSIQKENLAENPNSYASRGMNNVGRRMTNDAVANLKAFTTMFTLDRNSDVVISEEFLKKFWAPKSIQKCDPEYSAKDVEDAWKSSGRTIDEKIASHRSHSYGPLENYDYDDRGQPIQPRAATGRARK